MIIISNDIVTDEEEYYDEFIKLDSDGYFSSYKNNFNIIYENIEFEDINLKNSKCLSLLYYTVCKSNNDNILEIVRSILKYNPDINDRSVYEITILQFCCMNIQLLDNFEIIKLLLEHNADVNLLDSNGDTALIQLVENNNLKAIKLLLKYGAKINIKNKYDESAIDISIEKYKFNSEITQTLLNYDKNINYKFSNYLDFNFIYKN
jgi:ankyrin repeat protein